MRSSYQTLLEGRIKPRIYANEGLPVSDLESLKVCILL